MAYEITMPQLGESVTEGQIVRWLKAPGDRVGRFEPVVEVLTDKVTVEVPSPAEGILAEIRVREGQTVPVGTVLALLEVAEPSAEPAASPAPAASQVAPEAAVGGAPASASPGAARRVSAGETGESESEERGRYSPAVRRLAREYGVDLSQVAGTGQGGRITREDVLRFVEQRGRAEPSRPDAQAVPAVASAGAAAAPGPEADAETLTPSPVRAVIARRMVESWTTVPHAWAMVEADVTALSLLRDQVRDAFSRREGFELTYLPFAIKAVVEALVELPDLNASWVDGRIVRHRRIHVGVAVGLDEGLLVPVIKDADRLSVVGLARAVHDLVSRARAGRLAPDDLQGGTFTVNNTGALGSILSAPIIYPSQAAILTTEAVTRRLVVLKDDQIAIRSIMNLCLSFDHRLVDGVHALRFLNAVRRRLEAFGPGSPLT